MLHATDENDLSIEYESTVGRSLVRESNPVKIPVQCLKNTYMASLFGRAYSPVRTTIEHVAIVQYRSDFSTTFPYSK